MAEGTVGDHKVVFVESLGSRAIGPVDNNLLQANLKSESSFTKVSKKYMQLSNFVSVVVSVNPNHAPRIQSFFFLSVSVCLTVVSHPLPLIANEKNLQDQLILHHPNHFRQTQSHARS